MNSSDAPVESNPQSGEISETTTSSEVVDSSMEEYYQLQRELLLLTVIVTLVIFATIFWFYPLKIALNYLLGAVVSMVYLRMLGRDVERLGQQGGLSKNRLAVFAGLIIVATQWQQLEIMPVFLGFLTYKAALIIYAIRTVIKPSS
ncbi:MAG: ATP synthase subunit I [Microcoleaceae cyanobacterium]